MAKTWNLPSAFRAHRLYRSSSSPSRLASRIDGPVLLIHGREDTVVPFEQSEIMERAMRAAGKDVELIALDREDHHMTFPATRRQMLTETIRFLEEHNPPR